MRRCAGGVRTADEPQEPSTKPKHAIFPRDISNHVNMEVDKVCSVADDSSREEAQGKQRQLREEEKAHDVSHMHEDRRRLCQ